MTFLAPAWIALAGVASLGVVAIHFIAWRLPRVVALPTARFVPDEPARLAARTFRPSDLALMALRIGIIMAGGLALAKPVLSVSPSGNALVIAIERSIAVGDTVSLLGSVRGVPSADEVSYVVFDTTARVFSSEAEAFAAATAPGAGNASLTAGLIAATREARRLQHDYENVRVVVASSFAVGLFDRATMSARSVWGDSITLVRVPAAARAAEPLGIDVDSVGDDPVVAGIRLAQSNGLLRGVSKVIRDSQRVVDSALTADGRALVVWPRRTGEEKVDGVHATDATAIGYFIRGTTLVDSGARVVARWADGAPAAIERPLGSGCVRTIGFDVADAGDFVLTPAFQRLISVLVAPCGERFLTEVATDSVLAAVAAPAMERRAAALDAGAGAPNRVAAALMVLAMILALAELAVRRSSGRELAP